jgi:hypothetical protein
VATLYDVTIDADAGIMENFPLPSSGPVSCTAPISFAFVVPGHRYAADIAGYDRSDIEALAPGSPIMVDPESGATVKPRWTTSCGRDDAEGVLAVGAVTQRVSHCAPLEDNAPSPSTEALVSVSIDDSLGALSCGSAAGEIDHFEVSTGEDAAVQADCGASALLSGLTAGSINELTLLAFEAGQATPSFGTECSVTPEAGVTVDAVCGPLVDQGALDIDLPAVLGVLSLSCDASLREIVLDPEADPADPTADPAPERVTPPDCTRALRLSNLAPGTNTVQVTTSLADGSVGPSATCSGNVLPGLAANASCVAD